MSVAAGQVHYFATSAGLLSVLYLVSVAGVCVGLACTLRARRGGGGASRTGWLAGAAVSIGGVGIWLMHFMTMLGFDTPGMPVRYDVGWTVLSALLSISAVFVGLLVFGVRTRFSLGRLLLGGLVMGFGINLMHYTGARAIQIQGTITYTAYFVGLSIAIGIVAAVTALLSTVLFDNPALRIAAAMVVGIAVTGMHYAGMAAIEVRLDPAAPAPDGVKAFTFLLPVLGLAVLALAIPIHAVVMPSNWRESDGPNPEDLPKPPTPSRRGTPPARPATKPREQVRGVAQYARVPTIPAQSQRHH
jgi:NO-binding membrane sensor protein with MHYT domain